MVLAAARVDHERMGRWTVSARTMAILEKADQLKKAPSGDPARQAALSEADEALKFDVIRNRAASSAIQENASLRQARYDRFGAAGFVRETRAASFAGVLSRHATPLASLIGVIMLAWWFVMVTFQGEGVELDVQRRRHPMWEWLFSHPVRPGAVFLAEMIAPLSSNPNVLMSPVFWVTLFGMADYSPLSAVGAGVFIGLPLAVAASCLNKALEIGAFLRLSPRNRGAFLGLMSWIGFVSFFGALLMARGSDLAEGIARWIAPLGRLGDFPLLAWLMGFPRQRPEFWFAVVVGWALAFSITALAVWLSARATRKGLAGGFGSAVPEVVAMGRPRRGWARDPLYRKELLWFRRDRGAVVQAILVPATLATFQIFNLRNLLREAHGQWSAPCTMAVIFGTYFLFVLGPRSLLSEGPALWIALTWPRGLESLLKAKARLWSLLANVPVGIGLVLATIYHPAAWWKILLVAIGWLIFSRSLAEKSVTLVQASSSSGEPEPIPRGRRYAAWLGTFTFASGIASQQWYLAFTGVVYSALTSAAMWQNFRARLPFLFDPWSERLPPPPTLLHGMVAIFGMTEFIATVSAIAVGVAGKNGLWTAQAVVYGVAGLITWTTMSVWLSGRGVKNREVWRWGEPAPGDRFSRLLPGCALGVGGGAALGFLARLYTAGVEKLLPDQMTRLHQTFQYLARHPDQRWSLLALGVLCAPLAEEYLFRGLLFRALDREWGGWRAVLGSACFFAIYHPPVAWLPVAALGVLNALLFRHTRRLWPAVLAHACYNAIVLS
jgi:membrane protease YdiL (CAAX protease family)